MQNSKKTHGPRNMSSSCVFVTGNFLQKYYINLGTF